LQYDLFYIKNQNLALDATIMFETIKTILFGKGTLISFRGLTPVQSGSSSTLNNRKVSEAETMKKVFTQTIVLAFRARALRPALWARHPLQFASVAPRRKHSTGRRRSDCRGVTSRPQRRLFRRILRKTGRAETADEAEIVQNYNNFFNTYKLGPEDVVSVTVFGQDRYSRQGIKIPPSGRISLALIPDGIFVSGKTVDQVAELIKKRYDEYILEPQVSVSRGSGRFPIATAVIGDVGQRASG
jgi:hypothetical protein